LTPIDDKIAIIKDVNLIVNFIVNFIVRLALATLIPSRIYLNKGTKPQRQGEKEKLKNEKIKELKNIIQHRGTEKSMNSVSLCLCVLKKIQSHKVPLCPKKRLRISRLFSSFMPADGENENCVNPCPSVV